MQDNLDGNWNCTAVHIMARNKIVNRRFQWNTFNENNSIFGGILLCAVDIDHLDATSVYQTITSALAQTTH